MAIFLAMGEIVSFQICYSDSRHLSTKVWEFYQVKIALSDGVAPLHVLRSDKPDIT